MALNDLTPQLRTRLSRLERVVGWFVTVATLLLLCGLGYYVYNVAERKGWFLRKVYYYTFVRTAAGLKVGEPVRLMGRDAGEIMEITPMPPDSPYNIYVRFRVREGFYGYLWDDSKAKVAAGDFLGNRYIEVTKGTNGSPTYMFYELLNVTLAEAQGMAGKSGITFAEELIDPETKKTPVKVMEPVTREKLDLFVKAGPKTVLLFDTKIEKRAPTAIWDEKEGHYQPLKKGEKGYYLQEIEPPPLADRLETVVNKVESALPSFLGLTNTLVRVLTNADNVVTHTDELLLSAKPIFTNFATITSNLRGPNGTLGDWLLPTNINAQLQATLGSANSTVNSAHTNVDLISSNLVASLVSVSALTSNLAAQVQANGLILTEISELVIHTDEVVQGLKRHWLFKSAFAPATNAPVQSVVRPRIGPAK
jgi:ABC-type transporter Mla subunit MlaD